MRFLPKNIINKVVNSAFTLMELPPSNNAAKQAALGELYLANAMASRSKKVKDTVSKKLKEEFASEIGNLPINESRELTNCYPFILNAKKSNKRATFDKGEFIKCIAEEYDLSIIELNKLAKDCVKYSAAPIAFEVTLNSDISEEYEGENDG